MIKTEFYKEREDGVNLYRTYSDQDVMIQKGGTGEIYAEAIDVEDSGCNYSETDIPIQHDSQQDIEDKAAAFDIIMKGDH